MFQQFPQNSLTGTDPLDQFFFDFSNPNAFMSNLGPRQGPPSSGGPKKEKKPKPLVDQVPPGLSTSSTSPTAPAPAPAPAPTMSAVDPKTGKPVLNDQPMNPERARFIASLAPHKQARIQAADNPLSLKRAAEWEANQIAGYDAREALAARKARQKDALIRQMKQKETQREQARKYRANLATELEASRQYGEQNPAKPTGPSPEEQMAANRAAVKADNDYIVKMNKDYLAALSAEEAASRAYGEANPAKPLNGGMTASEELAKTRADYDAEAAAAKRIRDDATLERIKKRFADQAASYSVVPNTTPLPLPVNPVTDKYNRDQAEMAKIQDRILSPVLDPLQRILDNRQRQDVKNLLQSTPTGRLSGLAESPAITGSQAGNPLASGPTAEQAGGFAPGFNPNLVQSNLDAFVDERARAEDKLNRAGISPVPYEVRDELGKAIGDPGLAGQGNFNSNSSELLANSMRNRPQQGPVVGLGGKQVVLAQPDTSGQRAPGMTRAQLNNLVQALENANATGDTAKRDAILGRMTPEQRAEVEAFMRSPSYGEFGSGAAIGNYSVPQGEGAVSQFYSEGAQNFQEGNYGQAALDYLAGTGVAMVPFIGYDPLDSQDPFGPVGLGAPRAASTAVRAGAASLNEAAHLDAAARAAAAQAANPAKASRTLRSAAIQNAEAALQTRAQIDATIRAERMAARDATRSAEQALSRLAEPDVPNVNLSTPMEEAVNRFAGELSKLSPERQAEAVKTLYNAASRQLLEGKLTRAQFDMYVRRLDKLPGGRQGIAATRMTDRVTSELPLAEQFD